MAIEFAESGVRVNCVAPGVVYSKTARANYPVDVFEMARPEIPAQRLGTPDEISAAVTFLLSPGAAFISGATLRVDSGSSLYAKPFTKISRESVDLFISLAVQGYGIFFWARSPH